MMRNQLTSDCDGCNSEEKWILHNIRHRGIFRRLCTSCVLKFNPDSFCCVCYQVFHLSDAIPCSKCPSLAHLHCVCVDPNSYLCPPCSDPSFSYSFADNKNYRFSGDGKLVVGGTQQRRVIDPRLAKLLVAASWIASVSMRKAAIAKRMDAECRLKDAAFAKKAAMESLELLASTILSKTNGFNKENEVEIIRVPDPVKPANAKPQEQQVMKKKKKNKNKNKKKSKATVSVGGPNPVKLSIANKKTKKKNKKTKKSKTSGAIDASQNGLYKQAKSYGNRRAKYDNEPSNIVGSCGNAVTISDNLPKAVHRDPNNNAFVEDRDKSESQKYALVKCGNLNNSQGHIVKKDSGNSGSLSALSDTGHLQQHPHSSHGVT